MVLIHRFDELLPGYYGFRGMKILNIETARPLTPVEYVQQILVPEAALLLIRDDLLEKNGSVDWDEAYQTLQKSSEFGSCMYLDDTAE
ncbi:hypothetical protein VTP01DRAFT_9308 [Rhizomucor pusillus]|uniref:uncharacterized protein n=1 Tax=Rhizomucor pusillus TaxID=4840 RepID=UPI00374277C2